MRPGFYTQQLQKFKMAYPIHVLPIAAVLLLVLTQQQSLAQEEIPLEVSPGNTIRVTLGDASAEIRVGGINLKKVIPAVAAPVSLGIAAGIIFILRPFYIPPIKFPSIKFPHIKPPHIKFRRIKESALETQTVKAKSRRHKESQREAKEVSKREKWQKEAREEKPPETCQPCTMYCQKVNISIEPALHKVTHLTCATLYTASGRKSQEMEVKGKVISRLNKALSAYRSAHGPGKLRRHLFSVTRIRIRKPEKPLQKIEHGGKSDTTVTVHRSEHHPEKLQRLVSSTSNILLQQIWGQLSLGSTPRDISITAHLEGSKVTSEFVLYHCVSKGPVNAWEEVAKWTATIKDKCDQHVATLRGLDPSKPEIPQKATLELTRQLTQFIAKA